MAAGDARCIVMFGGEREREGEVKQTRRLAGKRAD